jgi:hypothetical protein
LGKADIIWNTGLGMAPFERNVTFALVDLQMIADYRPPKNIKPFENSSNPVPNKGLSTDQSHYYDVYYQHWKSF